MNNWSKSFRSTSDFQKMDPLSYPLNSQMDTKPNVSTNSSGDLESAHPGDEVKARERDGEFETKAEEV